MLMSNRYRVTVADAVWPAAPGSQPGLRQVLAWVLTGFDRASERRRLLALSERALADLALSRTDAEGEAAKPFWRA